MELRCIIIVLFLGLFSCQFNSSGNLSKVDKLTQALIANPTKENREALIVAYQDTNILEFAILQYPLRPM